MRERHHGEDLRRVRARALWIALLANGAFGAVEVVGGIVFASLALLADAVHMLVDVAALAIALIGQRLLLRPASARHTYGLQRAEVLAGLANGLLVIVLAATIGVEALRRLQDPGPVEGVGLIAVASLGLLVNLASAALIARAGGQSVNLRAALVHMVADAAGSGAAIAAGVGVVVFGASWVDSAASLAIVGLLLWAAADLVRDALHVLMEGVPRGMNPEEVESALRADEGVSAVHHLHLWNLASDVPALSAHVVLSGDVSLHEAQERGDRLQAMLAERFGIEHATLQLECHACDPAVSARPSQHHG